MTARSRWLVLLGISGFGLGILRNQNALAWSSLTILVWLFAEWLWFYWRVWRELPGLQFTRQVNGRTEPTGLVWCGRTIKVSVEMTSGNRRQSPVLVIRDCLPENLELVSGKNERAVISTSGSVGLGARRSTFRAGSPDSITARQAESTFSAISGMISRSVRPM